MKALAVVVALLLALASYVVLTGPAHKAIEPIRALLQPNRAPAISLPVGVPIQPATESQLSNGSLEFNFTTVSGTPESWVFPYSLYGKYLLPPMQVPVLILNSTVSGRQIYTYDYSSLVTPALFANAIGNLTENMTAAQFVQEVFNFREQLTTYNVVFGNTSQYPFVILADREGDCKDLAVLMASMLEAGNMQANYGMHIQLVYLDYPNVTDPKVVNHMIIKVIYRNGTSQLVESTGNVMDPYKSITGWYFNLTCSAASCMPLTACPYGEVLGQDGTCHAECGTSGSFCTSGSSCYQGHCVSCPGGYVLGTDGQCHAACGSLSTYCSSGGSCYNGRCVSCPAGDVVGSDGQCHAVCGPGTSYCPSGSSCYGGECVSCPANYSIGNDGICYHNQS